MIIEYFAEAKYSRRRGTSYTIEFFFNRQAVGRGPYNCAGPGEQYKKIDRHNTCVGWLVKEESPAGRRFKLCGGDFPHKKEGKETFVYQLFGRVILLSVGSFAALFLLTKMMGKRQMAQLSMLDYVTGITIGSIAAELAIAGPNEWQTPLIAMVVYALAAVTVSILSNKSIKMRIFFEGHPLVLFDNGIFFEENFKKAKYDVNEFLTNCRYQGYFDLADIQTALLETNGQISLLPKSAARPTTPEDIGLMPQQSQMVANVIIDGKIMEGILRRTGKDIQWLKKQLDAQGVTEKELLLGTVDNEDIFTAYPRAPEGDSGKYLFL